ncbi:S8 family serine peptidase [Sphingomonas sp. IW22]|uniref:S8 family serine peptidase n=1 Tax=Sphingomonas sp. IW22 TaxID=3242489 RepID=UPI0035216906
MSTNQIVALLNSHIEGVRGAITDIRQAAGNIELLLADEGGLGQQELVDNYAGRLTAAEDDAPVVCILDTGVSSAHPLIAPGLAGAWAVNAAWNSDDHASHGGHGRHAEPAPGGGHDRDHQPRRQHDGRRHQRDVDEATGRARG